MQKAEEKENIYWEIGEGLRQNPDLVMDFNSKAEIRQLVASGKYAAIWASYSVLNLTSTNC